MVYVLTCLRFSVDSEPTIPQSEVFSTLEYAQKRLNSLIDYETAPLTDAQRADYLRDQYQIEVDKPHYGILRFVHLRGVELDDLNVYYSLTEKPII